MFRNLLMISAPVLSLALSTSPGKGQGLFWTELKARAVRRADLDGTNIEDLVATDARRPHDITVDLVGRRIYWTEFGGNAEGDPVGGVKRANMDGTDVVELVSQTFIDPWGIAIDVGGGKMYWTVRRTVRSIQRANLDGSEIEDLVTSGLEYPRGIALDIGAGKMYWADPGTSKIQRANLDGSNVEDLVTEEMADIFRPVGIALDPAGGKMYWTDREAGPSGYGRIWRTNLDGTDNELLFITADDQDAPAIALDVSAGKIYLTVTSRMPGEGAIWLANMDGSAVEQIISGLIDPMGIALAPREPVVATLDIMPGSCPNPLNVRRRGIVRIAVVGDSAFDVTEIGVDSLLLTRADGVGEGVQPITRRSGRMASLKDTSAPLFGAPCTCQDGGGDGVDDLVLRFSAREMIRSLELHRLPHNASVVLTLGGSLLDERSFQASDCIVVKGRRNDTPGRRRHP